MKLSGTILTGSSFEPISGTIHLDNGIIQDIEETSVSTSDIILPAFVNAHTHIGDSIAKEAGRGLSLDELVAPPDGLKHRLLEQASYDDLVTAMRRSIQFMVASGTTTFLEFREGGVEGVNALHNASEELPIEPIIFGREDIAVLDHAHGYGASGARDADFSAERQAAQSAGKLFGIHAGERDPDDIDPALALDPDFLVHMVYAEQSHLTKLTEQEIPVIVCPRSNLVTKVGTPPIKRLHDHTTVALGTDNVMLNNPSMFREMEFVAKICEIDAPTVLRMATTAGAKIVGGNYGVIEAGKEARLLVLDGDSHNLTGIRDPIRGVVRRAGIGDVKQVIWPH